MVKKLNTTVEEKSCSAAGYDLRVHHNNTYETAKAIKGMNLKDAENYLEAILEHKRCIPFTRFEGATVRTVLALVRNARSNAEAKRLDVDNVYVKLAEVNQAQKGRRRTYRAHGRINAYLSTNCHVKLTCVERAVNVKKEKNVAQPEQRSLSVKRRVRQATASAMRQRKWVQVGKKN